MKGDNIFEAMSFIDSELIEKADEAPKKAEKNSFALKIRKTTWISSVTAVIVALILCSAILLNHIINPGSDLIGDTTTGPGLYIPSVDTTTVSGNNNYIPGEDITTAPIVNVYVPNDNLLLNYSVASPSYPIMAKFPSNEDEYYEWRDSLLEREKYYGAGKNLTNFFKSSTQAILGDVTTENAVYSPVNVYMTLAMLAETSTGNTRAQILNALDAKSIEGLRTQANSVWNACYRDDDKIMSRMANSLWLNEKIKTGDTSILAENYYASVFRGDMSDDEYGEAYTEWLKKETGGFLNGIIDDKKFDSDTVMTLASTLYFKASWDSKFNKELTKKGVFHSPTGDVTYDFMNQKSNSIYFYGEMYSATYKTLGNDGYMYFILPDEDVSISELLSNDEALAFIYDPWNVGNNVLYKVNLSLPKFDISMKKDLKSDIEALGITDCFDSNNADFSEFFPENKPFVYEMEHGVRVSVDEESCSGAAYFQANAWGSSPTEEIDFILDRPFIFVITGPDGLPLFIGVVNQP